MVFQQCAGCGFGELCLSLECLQQQGGIFLLWSIFLAMFGLEYMIASCNEWNPCSCMITISIEYCVFIVISISYCTFGFYWANRSILCWFVSHFSPPALTIVKFDHFEESFYEFLPFVMNLFYVNCWIIWLRIDGCYLCVYVLEKWEILVPVKRKIPLCVH